MKQYSQHRFASSLALATLLLSTALAQTANRPTVITIPTPNTGSNASRAPFLAARQFDDAKRPDGLAIDRSGANSDVANIEPAIPTAQFAILQPTPAPNLLSDPGLMPTGRSAVAASTLVNASAFGPTIRGTPIAERDQIIADLEARVRNSETAMTGFRNSATEMSADGRRVFKAADDEVTAKANALKKSVRAARKASATEWDAARAQLAADVEAYGAALARVDAAAGLLPSAP